MKIADWEAVGPISALVEKQVGMLGATEYASHVAKDPDSDKLRILMATDVGLLDYTYGPTSGASSAWSLHGRFNRLASVKGLRLQTDALIEEPKAELSANSEGVDEHSETALLEFAQACIQYAG